MSGTLGRGLSSLIPGPGAKAGSPAVGPTVTGAAILQVPTSQIAANPHQPRHTIDHADLEDLINSIREHGILQPLVLVKSGSGYQLIAGERRLRAAKIAGLRNVPAIVRDATTQQQLELAIVENVQRKDLNPIERAQAYQKLIEEFGLTQERVAKRVGKSRASIANVLRLLELPKEVQAAVLNERISEGHAKVIAGAATRAEQLKLLKSILEKGLSVRSGEALARSGRRKLKPANPEYIAIEEDLRERFGTRVQIDRQGRIGRITIEFYSPEEFRTIVRRLRGTAS